MLRFTSAVGGVPPTPLRCSVSRPVAKLTSLTSFRYAQTGGDKSVHEARCARGPRALRSSAPKRRCAHLPPAALLETWTILRSTLKAISMTHSIRDDLRQLLYCAPSCAHGIPPRLAHYTSVSTLEKIVASREMWLSSALYMNDSQELLYGMDAGASEFRSNGNLADACGSPTNHANLIKSFDERLKRFDSGHALDTYVLCLSKHRPADDEDGRLSMWRGYGDRGNGVALVFDSEKLTPAAGAPLTLGKVMYAGYPDT